MKEGISGEKPTETRSLIKSRSSLFHSRTNSFSLFGKPVDKIDSSLTGGLGIPPYLVSDISRLLAAGYLKVRNC